MNTSNDNNNNNKSDPSRQQPGQSGQQGRDAPDKQAASPGKGQGETANETRKADSKDSERK
jgi:hypothetical protein